MAVTLTTLRQGRDVTLTTSWQQVVCPEDTERVYIHLASGVTVYVKLDTAPDTGSPSSTARTTLTAGVGQYLPFDRSVGRKQFAIAGASGGETANITPFGPEARD